MFQAIVKKGKVIPVEVPPPMLSANEVIIQVRYSAISAGTEMINVKTSGENIFQRVKDQPENLKKVLQFLQVLRKGYRYARLHAWRLVLDRQA